MVASSSAGRRRLHVITGPMFSGKTDALIDQLEAHARAGASVVALKPAIDGRYGSDRLVSHSRRTHPALPLGESAAAVPDLSGFDVIGIDEVQFLAVAVEAMALGLRAEGRTVIAAGLDLDFLGRPFESTLALIDSADSVERRTARCGECGETATLTQRLVDGLPAPSDDERVRIGSAELYQPRCPRCFVARQLPIGAAASEPLRLRPTAS